MWTIFACKLRSQQSKPADDGVTAWLDHLLHKGDGETRDHRRGGLRHAAPLAALAVILKKCASVTVSWWWKLASSWGREQGVLASGGPQDIVTARTHEPFHPYKACVEVLGLQHWYWEERRQKLGVQVLSEAENGEIRDVAIKKTKHPFCNRKTCSRSGGL